jgi:hypothetical protein
MLVVRVPENVRAVQSSYYSSCPWVGAPTCLSRHIPDVETEIWDHDISQPWWIGHFLPQHIPVMLNLTFFTMTNSNRYSSYINSSVSTHGYATKERCRTERKSRNLEYVMGVRLTGFTK